MTMQLERKMLEEIRTMAAMDKSDLAEAYKIPIDSADVYFKTKTTAVLDVIIDGLTQDIELEERRKHDKGIVVDTLAKI